MKKKLVVLLGALSLQAAVMTAQAPLPVPQVGVMKDIPGAHQLPDAKTDYKIVFDMRSVADSPEQVNPALESVGVLVNTLRKNGVPADHLHMVAVFHGKTVLVLATDETYRQRTGVKANPNMELLKQLDHLGVKMAVCGQSALGQHYDASSLVPFTEIDLSATVTFLNLQSQGYIKVER